MFNWLLHTPWGIVTTILIGWFGVMTPLTWLIAHYWRQIGFWKPCDDTGWISTYPEERDSEGFVSLNCRRPENVMAVLWPVFWVLVSLRHVAWPTFQWCILKPVVAFYAGLGNLSDRLASRHSPARQYLLTLRRQVRTAEQERDYWKSIQPASSSDARDATLHQQEIDSTMQRLKAIRDETVQLTDRVMNFGLSEQQLVVISNTEEPASKNKVAQ